MNDIIKKAQREELGVLCEVDRVCKCHNIKYYIAQGTLLGAVKYKGFIPWDDDIDLLVPYDELDRLMGIFPKEADEKFFITNHKVEKAYPLSWTKVRVNGTLSRPVRYKEMPIHWGVCIDLFPIYPISRFSLVQKAERIGFKIANKMMMAEYTKYEEGHDPFVRMLEKVPFAIRHFCLDAMVGILKCHKKDSKYVLLPCKGVKIAERSMIEGGEEMLEFEGGMYPAPKKWHEYLTINFGDYAAPLPKHLQKGHDMKMGEIEWKFSE